MARHSCLWCGRPLASPGLCSKRCQLEEHQARKSGRLEPLWAQNIKTVIYAVLVLGGLGYGLYLFCVQDAGVRYAIQQMAK